MEGILDLGEEITLDFGEGKIDVRKSRTLVRENVCVRERFVGGGKRFVRESQIRMREIFGRGKTWCKRIAGEGKLW